MKIATWNLMRPNSKTVKRNNIFHDTINQLDPDILILTETNAILDFGDKYYKVATEPLPASHDGYPYEPGENRTTIYSKYPFIRQIPTSDNYTSVCAETMTPFGQLIIYGTIIGFLGGRGERFDSDLKAQKSDLLQIIPQGNICLAVDLNITFSGYTYPSTAVRKDLEDFFFCNKLIISTATLPGSAVHCV